LKTKIKLILAAALMLCLGLNLQCAIGPQPRGERSATPTQESPEECIAKYTLAGALIGGCTGALGGAAVKGKKGAVRGGVGGTIIGGLLGYAYAWGKCFDKLSTIKSEKIKDYDETVRTVDYRKEEGTKVKIMNFLLNPTVVRPGETVTMNAQYYALDPVKEKDLLVTEMRVLKVYDEEKRQFVEVGRVPNDITIAPGLRNADGTFPIPPDAPEGRFVIGLEITCAGKIDKAEMPLTIKKA